MTHIVLRNFGGMIPRLGQQHLPENMADVARNCLLLSGELRGLHSPELANDFTQDPDIDYIVRRAYRLRDSTSDFWVPFDDNLAHFLKGPLVNDKYDRYYWTAGNRFPSYSPKAELIAGAAPRKLGVPAPSAAPTLGPPAASEDAIVVTRAYVYTFVTDLGEEGPPSPPAVDSGPDDGTWTLSALETTLPGNGYIASKKRIYRTVSGQSGATDYHFVAELDITATTIDDDNSTADVALNDLLETYSWYPPPDGWDEDLQEYDYTKALQGIVTHPNGFLVGYVGRDLYFSEPYRPHAWPPEYVTTAADEIIGLGIFGTSVVVATKGYPYVASGINPASISFVKDDTPEPCLSHWSVVSMPYGVLYASKNGLVLVNQSGAQVATSKLMTRDEWADFSPQTLEAGRYNNQYIGFYNKDEGIMFSPDEPQAAIVALDQWWTAEAVMTDQFTGDVILLNQNKIFRWNPPDGTAYPYQWRSKEFDSPKPVNFGAFRCEWRSGNALGGTTIDEYRSFNAARIAYPLNPINSHVLNGSDFLPEYGDPPVPGPPPDHKPLVFGWVPKYPIFTTVYPHKMPVAGSPLYDIAALELLQTWIKVRVFANDELVYSHTLEDTNMYRLPAGYKATRWEIEIEGNAFVKNFKMAETGKELATV